MKVFLKLVLQKMRFAMLLKFAAGMDQTIKEEVSEEDFNFLKDLSSKKDANISSGVLLQMLEAYDNTGRAYIPELPLELALVKILGQNSEVK
jgi:hypothetical protein